MNSQSQSNSDSYSEESSSFEDIAFPYLTGIVVTDVHPDLENEPYTLSDTGARPKLPKKSEYSESKFVITEQGARFNVKQGTSTTIIREQDIDKFRPLHHLEKTICQASVVDIYNNYGLQVTYSFLHHIFHNRLSRDNPWWLHVYISGSLAMFHPAIAGDITAEANSNESRLEMGTLAACSHLLSELLLLELREKK